MPPDAPEPTPGMVIYDVDLPLARWRVLGFAIDGRIEAERIKPAPQIRHSWDRDAWEHAWERGWLVNG